MIILYHNATWNATNQCFVELQNNIYAIKVSNGWFELSILNYYGEQCGHYYHKCVISDKLLVHLDDNDIRRSCILLPLLCSEGIRINQVKDLCVYTDIAEDYTEFDENGLFVRKTLHFDNF